MNALGLPLLGNIAIVTGGGSGIGRAIALEFAKAGADIVVAGRGVVNLEKVTNEVIMLGRHALAVQTDVSKKTDVENLVKRTIDKFGTIDILVNNAGIANIGGSNPPWLIELPEDNWDLMLDTDLKSVYFCCQVVGKIMVERKKGNIVNISSRAALYGSANPYGIAKAGVIRLTRGLARDLGPYNIRVNAIAPSWTRSEVGVVLTKEEHDSFNNPKLVNTIPLGRIAEPSEIASIALFLASDASSYVTGQTIVADGGAESGGSW